MHGRIIRRVLAATVAALAFAGPAAAQTIEQGPSRHHHRRDADVHLQRRGRARRSSA